MMSRAVAQAVQAAMAAAQVAMAVMAEPTIRARKLAATRKRSAQPTASKPSADA
jgi:hypothetical protein